MLLIKSSKIIFKIGLSTLVTYHFLTISAIALRHPKEKIALNDNYIRPYTDVVRKIKLKQSTTAAATLKTISAKLSKIKSKCVESNSNEERNTGY